MSKILAVFSVPGSHQEHYDSMVADLKDAGVYHQSSRPYHFAAPQENGWYVVDVWDSAEALQEFAGTLMPLFAKHGINPPAPSIYPIHNMEITE
jgi:hypothetical protein